VLKIGSTTSHTSNSEIKIAFDDDDDDNDDQDDGNPRQQLL